MTIEECYSKLRGNYAEAKTRLMNDKLIERFILKFPDDPSMHTLSAMIETGDIERSFRAVHTLKGVAANLAFTQLFRDASNLTEQLRPLQQPADPELYDTLKKTYNMVISTLENYKACKS